MTFIASQFDSPITQPDPRFSRYGPDAEAELSCMEHGSKERHMLVRCSHGYARAHRAQSALCVLETIKGFQTTYDEASAWYSRERVRKEQVGSVNPSPFTIEHHEGTLSASTCSDIASQASSADAQILQC
jgi:hypothetical protein